MRPRTGPFRQLEPGERRRIDPAKANRTVKRLPFRVFALQGNGWTLLGGAHEQMAAEKLAGQQTGGRAKVLDRHDREVATFYNGRKIA